MFVAAELSSEISEALYNFRSIHPMKTIIRASVIVLALTGSAAYTQINLHGSIVLTGKTNSMPMPACHPNDPSACGMH